MKNLVLCCALLLAEFLYSQELLKIDSKVIEATVFKNRALVTREAHLDLSGGKHKLIFSNLPVDLLNESVRISASGTGIIKILDVKVEQRFTTEIQQDNIKALERQIDSLNQLMQIAYDKISIYESKKGFIEALKLQSSKSINERMFLNIKSSNLNELLKYIDKNLSEVYKGLREENRKRSFFEQQKNSIQLEVNESKGRKTKNYKEVIVTIETERAGNTKLYPSYIVQSAGWYPLYDARVISEPKEVELSYYGMIQQSTGEDWNDISLVLSTAEPLSVKSLPVLERWFVDTKPLPVKQNITDVEQSNKGNYRITYDQNWGLPPGTGSITGYIIDRTTGEALIGANVLLEGTSMASATDISGKFFISNVPAGQYNLLASYIGYHSSSVSLKVIEKNTVNIYLPLEQEPIGLSEVVITSGSYTAEKNTNAIRVITTDEQKVKYSNVYAKELSTSFEIPTISNIPSDNSHHKVTIAIENLSVRYSYTSIPKIVPSVYLKGKIANDNDYPLLEGEINVFVDDDFVNRTHLNTVVPTDTLELALGIDERIKVKRVLINKFQESTGFLSGNRQITYEYEIEVINNRPTEEIVLVYDQIPIEMNEDISVELIEPRKEVKELGSDRRLQWTLNLAPSEKKIIPLKYVVTFPQSINVFGLE